jgi:cytochrome c oxidase subunit 2
MQGKIIVMPETEYQRWLQTGISMEISENRNGPFVSMASRGARLFTRLGCNSCHGVNPGVRAPPLAGIFGKAQGLSDGKSILVDENYLRESILNPLAKIVQGYDPIMPSFAGVVSEEDVLDLIAYIKSLKTTPRSEAPEGPNTPTALPPPLQEREHD